ncbi:MAG: helix-turn-helix transcriptional regulator [Spirochaetales bacterium]|nr:helix-turn-helix transcriptional regulator [Spirochaetales bacterium]
METNEVFSKNLSRIRKLKGYSQRELAKITGISYRMINHYENNPTSVPINKIKILADALNTKIAAFFDDTVNDNSLDALDVRWIKKINEIRELPEEDRKEINRHISSLVEKHKLKEIHKVK